MAIMLQDVLQIEQLNDYKVHFAKWNGTSQPLDVFTRDRREWQGWQEYRPERDDFNRPYVFSLASFYHEPDTWLFGGVYEVIERRSDRYVVHLSHIAARVHWQIETALAIQGAYGPGEYGKSICGTRSRRDSPRAIRREAIPGIRGN